MGETNKAYERRKAAGWFDRYLVGSVLDVGCGEDKITPDAKGYDLADGDAQELTGIADESIDCLYSSHCLEHMRSPREAIRNWWRVVRPGGYMIIAVPDEDLYEQGYWPSLNNTDHKATFSIHKSTSWSPVHHNLTDLFMHLPKHNILSMCVVDEGYDYDRLGTGQDQTPEGAEAGIEAVVEKVAQELPFMTCLRNAMICPRCNRMELIARGTKKDDVNSLEVMCHNCGLFGSINIAR